MFAALRWPDLLHLINHTVPRDRILVHDARAAITRMGSNTSQSLENNSNDRFCYFIPAEGRISETARH